MNSNSFMRVRVQKKYFFEFKFEFGKMIEFFRVCSSGPDDQFLIKIINSLYGYPQETTKNWQGLKCCWAGYLELV